MPTLKQVGAWALGLIGAAVALGLQVTPTEAFSNAALWVQTVTGYLPSWSPAVDGWVTLVSTLIATMPLIVFLWLRGNRYKRVAASGQKVESVGKSPSPSAPVDRIINPMKYVFSDMAEEAEARRQAKLKKIREGED